MTSASAKERPHEVSGEVASVNVSDQTVVIKRSATNGVAQLKLLVDTGSKILVGNEKKSLSDVHVGDRVRGKYLNKDGKHIVRTLHLSGVSSSEMKSSAVGSSEAKPPSTSPTTQPASPAKQ
jgi:hypothetical protein